MAPISSSAEPLSLTPALLPPLWLLVTASLSTTRSRITVPLTLLTLCLAFQPLLHHINFPSSKTTHETHHVSFETVFRQVGPPTVDTPPSGPLATSPTPTPSPAPSPSPAPPVTIPQQIPPGQDVSDELSLDECSGGLKRMQVILLLELCFEILFLFLRCFAEQEETDDHPPLDVTMRGYIFVRAIYLVPVLGFNAGIYWVGGGPTGRCLSTFSAVQVPFVHLVFYAIYCVLIVIIGVYRIDQYDDKSTDSYYDSSSRRDRSSGPPTRTTSYFRGYGRRRTTTDSTSYEEPKFRVNLGCCRLNF